MSDLRAPFFHRCLKAGWFDQMQQIRYGQGLPAIGLTHQTPVMTISPAATALIVDLAQTQTAKELHPLAPLPAAYLWIEAPFPHHRAFVVSHDAWMALGLQDRENEALAFRFDPDRRTLLSIEDNAPLPVPEQQLQNLPWSDALRAETVHYYFALFVATCAVLATPGVRTVFESVKEKRLQRKQGQPAPIVTYRCVDVNIDALGDIPERKVGPSEPTGIRLPLHHVRGHLRLTEKKGLVPVRAHWRGSAEFGVRLKDSNIMRDEEMDA